MRIGIIRPYEIEYNPEDIVDLENAIRELGHTVRRIYIDMTGVLVKGKRFEFTQLLSRSYREQIDVDGAILRHLGVIRDFEQLLVRVWIVKALEDSGKYVMNPVLNWLIASDKVASTLVLARSGIPVPETFITENMFLAYDVVKEFGKVVVKQPRGAMGYGVFALDDPDVAMYVFSVLTSLNKPMYVQKFLERRVEGDYRIVVVGDEVVGAEFRRSQKWKSNVAQGAKPEPIRPNAELSELAIKAVRALGLDYGGVDVLETKEGYYVLEVNPTMSWQGFKRATGINPAYHIVRLLIEKLKR